MSDQENKKGVPFYSDEPKNYVSSYGKEAVKKCEELVKRSSKFDDIKIYDAATGKEIEGYGYKKSIQEFTCPDFVHKYYEIGRTDCPEGFATIASFSPENGKPFAECIGVVSNAVIFLEANVD